MNKSLGAAFAAFMVFVTGLLSYAFAAEAEPKGAITITIDDGRRNSYVNGQPIFRAHGLKGTLYLTVGTMGDTVGTTPQALMTWSEVKDWANTDGWEIGAHTLTHPHLPTLTDAELEDELGGAADIIEENFGIRPAAFAAPFGDIDDSANGDRAGTVEAMIKRHYESHAWWGGGTGKYGFNSTTDMDPYRIGRYDIVRDTDPVEACRVITEAANEDAWIVILFHGIAPHPYGERYDDYDTPTATVEAIAKCAGDLVASNRLRTGTVSEILATIPLKNGQPDPGAVRKADMVAAE